MGSLALNDDLSKMCQMFEEAEESTRPAREQAERDRDYYDSKQWTAEEKAKLEKRGQPAIVFNRIQRKVNSLLGLEKQTRKDPRAFPRNPQDEQSAHAATDAIRFVCDDNRWDDQRSSATEDLIIYGTGVVKVGVRQTRAGIDPELRHIAWDRYFYDPHSSRFDLSDRSFDGEVIWGELDDLKEQYPDKADALESTLDSAPTETYDDKPKHSMWADKSRRRVRVVELYYKKGRRWHFCIFTKGGFLVDPKPSPYLDDEKEPESPYKPVSLYIDRDNNRYGEVRTMIGPQDEINHRRSKAIHLLNQRTVRVSPSVSQDAEAVRKEISRADGVFVGENGEVEIFQNNDMAMGNLQMLQEAKTEIDLLGPNAALAGKNQQQQSGRAIMAQQQGGMLEAGTLLDRVRYLSLAVYRGAWNRIQQHWTAERWIRVTDNEKNVRFVGLNRPVTGLEQAAKQMGVTQDNFQQFAQQAPEQAQQLAMFAQSPQGQAVVSVENSVVELDVDITIDEGIDTPTIAAEQFDSLLQAASSGVIQIPPEVLIEASSFRNKEQLLEMLKQGPSPEQQQAQQLQLAGAQATVEETQSKTLLNTAKAQSEAIKPFSEGVRAGMSEQP